MIKFRSYNKFNRFVKEEYLPLNIQLVSGVLGDNVAGKSLKNMSLETLGNSIVGGVVLMALIGAIKKAWPDKVN